MNLLIVSDMVLGKHTLNLLEVPIGYAARNVIDFFRRPANMSVKAIRSVDAKAVTIIVAFSVQERTSMSRSDS